MRWRWLDCRIGDHDVEPGFRPGSPFEWEWRATNVINPDDVFPTLQKVFNADGPALVNIMTDPNALAMPPKIEFSQMLGFAQTIV